MDRRRSDGDFGYYASLPDGAGFVVTDGGAVAAVGWARRARREAGRSLDHVSIAPDADPVRAALGAWHAAAPAGERLMGCVPARIRSCRSCWTRGSGSPTATNGAPATRI